MKRKIIFLSFMFSFLVLALCFVNIKVLPVYATGIIRTQGNSRGTSIFTTTITVNMTSVPMNGNIMIACIGTIESGQNISSIVESGVTWYYIIESRNVTHELGFIWFGVIGSSASKDITITFNQSSSYNVADVCEYSGVANSSYTDKIIINSGRTLYPDSGKTNTTSQSDELWIANIVASRPQSALNESFTLLDGVIYMGATSLAYGENIVSSIGSAHTNSTVAGLSYWSGCIATFKAVTVTISPPKYDSTKTNTNNTLTIGTWLFYSFWYSDTNCSGFIFSYNASGSLVNDTWIQFSDLNNTWGNTTKTISNNVGNTISWIAYANNTGGWNSTSIQNIIVTANINFFFNSDGTLEKNGMSVNNSTSITYNTLSPIIHLSGVPNTNCSFFNFIISNTNITSNPYNFTVQNSTSVWCYFSNLTYQSGYTQGWIDGNASGFINGNNTGFILGNSTGYALGFTIGNSTGYSLGYSIGYSIGYANGVASIPSVDDSWHFGIMFVLLAIGLLLGLLLGKA